MMKRTGDGFKLSSGREIAANGCILGIDDEMNIYGGYDDMVELTVNRDGGDPELTLTTEERIEIAAYAIKQWSRYLKNAVEVLQR